MVTNVIKVRRMSIREFRAAIRSDMDLPLIITSDGQDAFAVLPFDMLGNALRRPIEMHCPQCKTKVRPQTIQGRCPSCREYMNVPNNGAT